MDTYWPAELVMFSPEISSVYATLLAFDVPGGDSVHDEMSIYAVLRLSANAPMWTISAGLNRGPINLTGRIYFMNGAYTDSVTWCLCGDYGNERCYLNTIQEENFSCELFAQNSECTFFLNGDELGHVSSTYDMEGESRPFYIRSLTTQGIKWVHYANSQTNVRFSILAMLSPGGSGAIYSDFNETLVEV